MKEKIFNEYIEFEWDDGNIHKNSIKHNVSWQECEEVFFNQPLLCFEDTKHSQIEKRVYVLGKTNDNRRLFIAFTGRDKRIRVVSARDMSKKEKSLYDSEFEESASF